MSEKPHPLDPPTVWARKEKALHEEARSAATLRDALIERWFDPEDTDPEAVTDEQILARIEDLVGEGWHAAGLESQRCERAEGEVRRLNKVIAYGVTK